MAAAHRRAMGSEPGHTVVLASTTDARIYLNPYAVPALCYGPRATRIHGIDEGVELRSIVDGGADACPLPARAGRRRGRADGL